MDGYNFTAGRFSGKARKIHHFLRSVYNPVLRLAVLIGTLFLATASFAQSPTLTGLEATALSYDEEQIPTAITETIVVSDGDSPLLASATVKITANYSSTEDLLLFTNAFSITGSYDPSTGTLTLTGPASPADFTSALRSVKYQNTNTDNPSDQLRTVSFSVNDGTSDSPTVTRSIQVNRINDIPVGQSDTFIMYEDTELDCGCLLVNDSDPDGDPLVALHDQNPEHGTVTDLGGFFIYTPNPDYYGTDTFTYFANDGTANSLPITVHITILPVNDAPIAGDDAVSTDEDVPLHLPLLSNDKDVDDVLNVGMINVIDQPAHGTVVINTTTATVVYTPAQDYNGNDSFTYQLKDASGALSGIATVNIIINPVNDTPVAVGDAAITPEEVAVTIPVVANDTDVDNALDPATVTVSSPPANGVAVADPATGSITYTPKKDFNGNDTFTYTVKDVQGAVSAPATVTVTVTPVNDPPVAVDDIAATGNNKPVAINVISNDFDVDDVVIPSSVTIVDNPIHGTLVVAATGVVTYTPGTDFEGNDSFTYTIADDDGLTSLPATVSILVDPELNKPPVAVDDGPIQNSHLAPVVIDVLANDYDVDDNHEDLTIVSFTDPSSGTVRIEDGKIVYQPTDLNVEIVTFTYTIQDPAGLTDKAVVTIENVTLPLAVSEGFSPNNDNNNETWYIQGIEKYPNNYVKVFDRWGFLVYQKQGYTNNNAWDGRGNAAQQAGKLLDQGTYYYILEPGGELGTLTGYVVIVR